MMKRVPPTLHYSGMVGRESDTLLGNLYVGFRGEADAFQ